MSFRYALSWAGGDHAWHHPLSFSCVVDAKTHAHEHAPAGSTHYEIRRIGGEYVVKGKLDDHWQSVGHVAQRVCADIRDHNIKMQAELNGEKGE
jgi:hypothetical protein